MAKAKRSRKLKKPKTESDLNAALDAMGPVSTAPDRIGWWRDRCALLDRHRRRSRMSDVEAIQELRSPTVSISVDDPEATRRARRNLTRVRQSEAWRHNRLSSMQRDAEKEFNSTWKSLTVGLQPSRMKFMATARGTGSPDARSLIEASNTALWAEWCCEARRRRISRPAFLDVLTEPKTLAEVERDRRLGRGHAFAIYTRGLDLWAELRGWTRSRATIVGAHLEASA